MTELFFVSSTLPLLSNTPITAIFPTADNRNIISDPNNEECARGIQNVENQINQQQASGKVDEQQIQRAMADPEIQAIMRDPVINNVITDMSQHPENIQRHLANPDIAAKIQKLIASGILRTSPASQ